jgi:hypothetical protein
MGDAVSRRGRGLRRLPFILIGGVLVAALALSSLAILATQQAAKDALVSAESATMRNQELIEANTHLTERVRDNGRVLRRTQRRIIKILNGVRIDCAGKGEVLECSLIVPQIEKVRVVTEEGEVRIIRKIVCRLPNGRRCPRPPRTIP